METAARSFVLFLLVIALGIGVSCSCQPTPSISSISPSNATAGGSQFTLTVNGNNFLSTSIVTFSGTSFTPTFVNSNQLVATIPASNIVQAGTFQVLVLNPPKGSSTGTIRGTTAETSTPACSGSDSNAVSFTVSQ